MKLLKSIGSGIDEVIGTISPGWGAKRLQSRLLMRHYSGAESSRLTSHSQPRNQAADSELLGPFGADAMRAWSRKLVRDNAYAWGVVDTIVSSVVGGRGIRAQSMLEDDEGTDIEATNWARDEVWDRWCEVCDINGQYSFAEMQRMVQREMVEAGEVLIHFVPTKGREHRGIYRPVPLALEMIEADRLASDQDTYAIARDGEKRIIRGVEMDDLGTPVAYWIYREHPNSPYASFNRTPERIPASEILHLFRRDRVGQSRGVSWFAPVAGWLRDLGLYVDNEIQASAVAACFTAVITTDGIASPLNDDSEASTTDADGNTLEVLEPALVARLGKGESIQTVNPGRPNSQADPWIALMLRGIAVGTGLSYEVVARDYSKTTYSSSRTSQLEDRRRFRAWQGYLLNHLCQPVWDRFCEAAAIDGREEFPTMSELLDDRRKVASVEWQTQEWEWVDPQNEQSASQASIDGLQSTYQTELGARGRNYRRVFYQRAKEEALKRKLGLTTLDEAKAGAQQAEVPDGTPVATGEMAGLSRLQFGRNRKAIEDILTDFASGASSEAKARVMLSSLGMQEESISQLLQDATPETEQVAEVASV